MIAIMNLLRRILLGIGLIVLGSSMSLAQTGSEICENAIDDDGDGLVDLNDPDCECVVIEPISLIPNPSFEDTTCCPIGRAAMDCANDWIQASEATTDYLHDCGWTGWLDLPVPRPFPDGEAVIGFRNGRAGIGSSDPDWKEYAGACLTTPLRANESYKFQFHVGFTNPINSPGINVTFFGAVDCNYLPFGVGDPLHGCPLNGPGWVALGSVRVSGVNEWRLAEINVTPTQDIAAIAIGPDCVRLNSSVNLYYYFDNLILADQSSFEFDIGPTTNLCDDDAVLQINYHDTLDYQWFKDGIALVGETSHQLGQLYGNGDYQVRIWGPNSGCRISKVFSYSRPETITEQEITICSGEEYLIGNNYVNTSGIYFDTLKTADHCDSIIQTNLVVFDDPKDTIYAKVFPGEQYKLDLARYYNPGEYKTVLRSKDGCDSTVYLFLSHYQSFIPSGFTPNGDGINDYFNFPLTEGQHTIVSFDIYNRWGKKVYQGHHFSQNNPDEGWDGRINGKAAPEGVYVYMISILYDDNKERISSGTITLVR